MSKAPNISDDIREEMHRGKLAANNFAHAAGAGDMNAFVVAMERVERECVFEAAFRAVSKKNPPEAFRRGFLEYWLTDGDHIRNEVGNDLTLISGLRALLPTYYGAGLRLYRAESAINRKHRRYGLSWTASRDIAENFVKARQGFYPGGMVLIETDAPAEAIICCPGDFTDRFEHEAEYLIDRRCLGAVRLAKK